MNMSNDKWPVGTRLFHPSTGVRGEVTPNVKMPGDICIRWDQGQLISYDEDVLDGYVADGVMVRES